MAASDLPDSPALGRAAAPPGRAARSWPTRSAPWRWMPCSRPTRATPGAPMGMAEIGGGPLGPAPASTTRRTRTGPSATASCSRTATRRCCSTRLLHLTGYDLPLAELRNFRQLHSKTPGHPELGVTPGVETTTGPLGQGLANAVGMALAEKLLAAEFNRDGHAVVDHRTYVVLRRRLPDGRHQPRGLRARRRLEARQADRLLRRQRHLDRRRGRALVRRRHAEALRGLRLERDRRRRRQRRRRGRRGDRRGEAVERPADASSAARRRSARARRTAPAPPRRTARRSASRRCA